MASIVYESASQGVALLTINRPEVKNALNWEAMDAFAAAIGRASKDSSLRALVIAGAEGAFCSGGDLYELDGYRTRLDGVRLAAVMGDALRVLETLAVPTVAAVEGPAMGGGSEIALACDMRVMAAGATLGLMHVRLAIAPAWGGGQRLLRLAGYSRALEWLAVGEVIPAHQAHEYGIANYVVPSGAALDRALAIAQKFAQRDPAAVSAIKQMLQAGLELPAQQALAAERALFPDLWEAPAHLRASERFVSRRNEKPR